MDSSHISSDHISHFDRPKTLELPDFEWVDEIIAFPPAAGMNHGVLSPDRDTERFIAVPLDTRRGVGWVLAWASALAVVGIAAGVLTEFAYVVAAERALSVAAQAGAMEATLPRATNQSITAAVDRRLRQYPLLSKQLHLSLLQNGMLVQTQFRQREGDHLTVTLSAPGSAAIPDWLRTLMFWRGASDIRARAEQQMQRRIFASGTHPRQIAHTAAE